MHTCELSNVVLTLYCVSGFQLKFNSSKSCSMLNLSNGGLTLPVERASPNMNKTQSQTDLAVGKDDTR